MKKPTEELKKLPVSRTVENNDLIFFNLWDKKLDIQLVQNHSGKHLDQAVVWYQRDYSIARECYKKQE